jgi:hypothetical protein
LCLPLLLAAVLSILWARSYGDVTARGGPDSFSFTRSDPYGWLVSNPGRLTFCHQAGREWDSPVTKFKMFGVEYAGSWVGGSSLVNLFVPYWMLIVPLLILPAAWLGGAMRDRRCRRRARLGLCANCGYDLRGSTVNCPECGSVIDQSISRGSMIC